MSLQSKTKVKLLYQDTWVYGEVTIVRADESKVMFEYPDLGLAYWYYKNIELIEVSEDEYRAAKESNQTSE